MLRHVVPGGQARVIGRPFGGGYRARQQEGQREHVPEERSSLWLQTALRHGDNLWQRRSFEESSATWVWWQPVVAARTRGFELDER